MESSDDALFDLFSDLIQRALYRAAAGLAVDVIHSLEGFSYPLPDEELIDRYSKTLRRIIDMAEFQRGLLDSDLLDEDDDSDITFVQCAIAFAVAEAMKFEKVKEVFAPFSESLKSHALGGGEILDWMIGAV